MIDHNTQKQAWNKDYQTGGVPTSIKDNPSKTLLWALDNLKYISKKSLSQCNVLDIGCGAGRNSFYLSDKVQSITAFDVSDVAISRAKEKKVENVQFSVQAVEDGLPAQDASIDIALDSFVSECFLLSDNRQKYRQELKRVLKSDGLFILSSFGNQDGFIQSCDDISDQYQSEQLIAYDKIMGIGRVTYSLKQLIDEMSDVFELALYRHSVGQHNLHGTTYSKNTHSTVWRVKK